MENIRPTTDAKAKSAYLKQKGQAELTIVFFVGLLGSLTACCDGRKGQAVAAGAQISCFSVALDMFKDDNGFHPTNLNELVTRPEGLTNWHQYMEKVPLDPWEHPYIYKYPGTHGGNSYNLISAGPDWRLGTEDDIMINR